MQTAEAVQHVKNDVEDKQTQGPVLNPLIIPVDLKSCQRTLAEMVTLKITVATGWNVIKPYYVSTTLPVMRPGVNIPGIINLVRGEVAVEDPATKDAVEVIKSYLLALAPHMQADISDMGIENLSINAHDREKLLFDLLYAIVVIDTVKYYRLRTYLDQSPEHSSTRHDWHDIFIQEVIDLNDPLLNAIFKIANKELGGDSDHLIGTNLGFAKYGDPRKCRDLMLLI